MSRVGCFQVQRKQAAWRNPPAMMEKADKKLWIRGRSQQTSSDDDYSSPTISK